MPPYREMPSGGYNDVEQFIVAAKTWLETEPTRSCTITTNYANTITRRDATEPLVTADAADQLARWFAK